MIKSLHLQNFLSFGPDAKPVELGALNIIIGTNGSGKSNFIEALEILRNAPANITTPITNGGGYSEFFWRLNQSEISNIIKISVIFKPELVKNVISYLIEIQNTNQSFFINEKIIKNSDPSSTLFETKAIDDQRKLKIRNNGKEENRPRTNINVENSILSQLKDYFSYPEMARLSDSLENIKIHRDWTIGKFNKIRYPQRADLPNKWLESDGSNLGLILNVIRKNPDSKDQFLKALKALNPAYEDFDVQVEGGTVQIFLQEGRKITPAIRLSDGTLRYLCLLAIFCHPNPPPLVCIEEPEIGFHPDVLSSLAQLIKDASKRMQLIVTTHSDIFVDCFSDTPEVIKVCDKIDGSTQIRSLPLEELKPWLAEYSLGNLWLKGHIGGNLY